MEGIDLESRRGERRRQRSRRSIEARVVRQHRGGGPASGGGWMVADKEVGGAPPEVGRAGERGNMVA